MFHKNWLTRFGSLLLAAVVGVSLLSAAALAAEDSVYSDVAAGDPAYEAVLWLHDNGYMIGTGNGKFSPDLEVSFGMAVTVLYRLTGEPEVAESAGNANGEYYSDAALWAEQQEFFRDVSETLQVDRAITGRTANVLLNRYAAKVEGRMIGYPLDSGSETVSRADFAAAVFGMATGAFDLVLDEIVADTPEAKVTIHVNPADGGDSAEYSVELADGQESIVDAESGEVLFALVVDNVEAAQFCASPVAAADEGFENCLAVEETYYTANAVYFSVSCGPDQDTLYIRTPGFTVIDGDAETEAKNVEGLEIKDVTNEENGIRLLYLTYSSDTFPVIPDGAVLLGETEDIDSVSSMVYFDEDNNVISGTLIFFVPADYVCPDTFDFLLRGKLVNFEGTEVTVPIR